MTKTTKDPFLYDNLAQEFCDDVLMDTNTLTYGAIHWQGETYLYDGKRYIATTEQELNFKIRRYLHNHKPEPIGVNNFLISNVLPAIRELISKDRHAFPDMPFYTGKDYFPKPSNVIAYNNGLLDMNGYLEGNATLISHTPHWVSPICLPYDYDPSAQCPQWHNFLSEVFAGDDEQIGLLQEYFGYCLSHDTSMEKFMLWVGVARGGKGTCWEMLNALMGKENTLAFRLSQLVSQFGLYPFVGKMVAYCGEAELKGLGDKKYSVLETLKNITGQDPMSIERKHYAEVMSVVLPTRLIIACNEMPHFYEVENALASRILLLRYNVSFVGREDYGLKARLKTEVSGVNNWALEGLARLRKNGRFSIPAKTEEALNEYKRNSSPEYGFIQDRCIVEKWCNSGNLMGVEMTDEAQSIDGSKFFGAYTDWCIDCGKQTPDSKDWVLRRMKTLLPKVEEKRGAYKKGVPRMTTYNGIGLKP
jgi:putative DNA primase/helicase